MRRAASRLKRLRASSGLAKFVSSRCFVAGLEFLIPLAFWLRTCAGCAPLISRCVDKAMGSLGWAWCGCCGEQAWNPYAMDTDEFPSGFVLICEECLAKTLNVYAAQRSFRLLFRTSRVFSSPAVAGHIGACLAQHWTVRELRKPDVWTIQRHWRP